jgi:hypothetical protein
MDSLTWLSLWQPKTTFPDSVSARLDFIGEGARQFPRLQANLKAAAQQGNFKLDDLEIGVDIPAAPDSAVQVRLVARTLGHVIKSRAEVDREGEDLVILCQPLHVLANGPDIGLSRVAPQPGIIRWQSRQRTLSVDNMTLTGEVGDLRLEGALAGDRGGSFHLTWHWPEPPFLFTRVLDAAGERTDWFRENWQRKGPYKLLAQGTFHNEPQQNFLSMTGTFDLPGPWVFGPIHSEKAGMVDLETLLGSFAILSQSQAGDRSTSLDVELEPTDWLEKGQLSLQAHGSDLMIDTCHIAGQGLSVRAQGDFQQNVWDVQAQVDLADAMLMGRFFPAWQEDHALTASARIDLNGSPGDLRATGQIEAAARTPNWYLPRLNGRAEWVQGWLGADLVVPEGLDFGVWHLDSLNATFQSDENAHSFSPGELKLDATGPDLGVTLVTHLIWGAPFAMSADTLAIRLADYDLRSTGPFEILFETTEPRIFIHNFELTGALGQVSIHGSAGRDSSDLTGRMDLICPPAFTLVPVPPELWPEHLTCDVRLNSGNAVAGQLTIRGFSLGQRRDATAHLDFSSRAPEGLSGTLEIADAAGSILVGKLNLPAMSLPLPSGSIWAGSLIAAEVKLTEFPLPLKNGRNGNSTTNRRDILLSGEAILQGTVASPVGWANAQLGFAGWPKLESYELTGLARFDSNGGAAESGLSRTLPLGKDNVISLPSAPVGGGVAAAFSLTRQQSTVLSGDLSLPASLSLWPSIGSLDPDRSLSLNVSSQELLLNEFDPLLPASVSLEGACRIDFSANGPTKDPHLRGTISFPQTQVTLADGTRVEMRGELKLSGTGRAPLIRGEFEIPRGEIFLPEVPKHLHPTQGEALLQAAHQLSTLPITPDRPIEPSRIHLNEGKVTSGRTENSAHSVTPNLDVTVAIPSGLWLRGQGLEVELAGDLRIIQEGLQPDLSGDLKAIRGFLRFLGRTFFIDRGSVSFFGGEDINPVLDLKLATRVEEIEVGIRFGGTLRKPEMELSSNPEMSEGDIISVLLFSRPLAELSNDQMG